MSQSSDITVKTEGQPTIKSYDGTHLTDIGKKMYLNAKTADVHFSFVSDDDSVRRIAAHKSVLAAASDVLEEMFYGESPMDADINVTDASEGAFIEFLQFFYLERAKLTIDNIVGVMHLGHKYNVPNCATVCVRFLKDVLTIDNVFIGLNLAILYGIENLMKFCEDLITLNTVEVFKTSGFLECDRQALAHILNIDVFSCSEVEMFEACMAWVRAKSKQNTLTKALVKKHLGDLYYEIRFKSMTMQELCALQMAFEAVLRADFAVITNMIVNPDIHAENFSNDRRHAKWSPIGGIQCDLSVQGGAEFPYKLWNTQTTMFSTNRPLLLGSFVCDKIAVNSASGIRDLNVSLPVTANIFEIQNAHDTDKNAKLLLTLAAKLQSKDANNIMLPHPVLIRPKLQYQISIGPFPDEHVYFSKGLQKRTQLTHERTVIKLHNRNVGKANARPVGLVSCFNFNQL